MAQPMYQQIAEDLRAQIESGILQPGAQLPTELELSDRYASSRNTIRDAMKRLTSEVSWRRDQAKEPSSPGGSTPSSPCSPLILKAGTMFGAVDVSVTGRPRRRPAGLRTRDLSAREYVRRRCARWTSSSGVIMRA